MSFGITDVKNAMTQFNISNPQHSCPIGSYSTTVKKTEEYRNSYLPRTLFWSAGFGRKAVTGMEKFFKFSTCK